MKCSELKEKYHEAGKGIVFYDKHGRETMNIDNIYAIKVTETMTKKEAMNIK